MYIFGQSLISLQSGQIILQNSRIKTLEDERDEMKLQLATLEEERFDRNRQLALRDLKQLACHKLGDKIASSTGVSLNQATVQAVKSSTIVTDADERDHLIACLKDAGHDDVHVAMLKVQRPGKKPGKTTTAYVPALDQAGFLLVLKPLYYV